MEETAGRFVGQSVQRKEDPRLLSGQGQYVDDVTLPGLLHVAFVRSDIARGHVTRVDVERALAGPGVRAVFTNDDLAAALVGPMVPSLYLGAPGPQRRPLADGDVRFVGEPVVLVVADSRYLAEDACDLVELDYEILPPVVDFESAASSPDLVHPELGSNVAASTTVEDPELIGVFANAPHVVTETFVQQRQTNVPMETRGIVVRWEAQSRRLSVWVSSQNPHEVRRCCARMLGLPEHSVRVIQADVGGGFGQKYLLGREEMCVVLAAERLGRPLKWIEDRRENLLASTHARADRVKCTVAVDDDGLILGVLLDHLEDVGAVPVGGTGGAGVSVVTRFPGPYKVPHLGYTTTSVWTNTCGRGAYRGPWMMETVAREQMMDCVARAVGRDPVELRRRNAIRAADQPYRSPGGMLVDKVSCIETLDQAAAIIAYDEFREEQVRARAVGRFLGIGFSLYIEPQGSFAALRVESATIRVGTDGTVGVYVGSGSHGQGIETTMAQVAAEHLGVHVDDVVVHQGDTDSAPFGAGTGGSRTGPFLAPAVAASARDVKKRAMQIAAQLLEAAPEDMELVEGRAFVRGSPSRSLTLGDVAAALYSGTSALDDADESVLEASTRFEAPGVVFSNACHACTCEVDPETGIVTLLRYVVSEDCGQMINPMVVEGQIIGGVAQGVGGALYEHVVYDLDGTPRATTFLDYLLPTSTSLPVIEFGHIVTSAATPGGHKGMGEGGAIGAPPCVANAIADALVPFGVSPTKLPLTPSAIVDLIADRAARPAR